MPRVSQRLIKDLQWLASHRGHSFTFEPKDARALLLALDKDWCPEVERGDTAGEAIKFLKKGLEERFGKKNVRVTLDTEEDTENDRVYRLVHLSVKDTAGWPDDVIRLLVKASGFSKHFEEGGSGCGMHWRDVTYVSRRGRKAS
jgi:hypothetical protein